jgi:hypothetical protein
MTLPRTVADVPADHVAFEVEEIDRVYLNVWQPGCSMARGGVASPRTARTGMRPGSEHTETWTICALASRAAAAS